MTAGNPQPVKLSASRFKLVLEESPPYARTAHEGPLGALAEAAAMMDREGDGRLFRLWRIRVGLSIYEVSLGWGVLPSFVCELERGRRRFPSPADAHAALQQLFQWACEKHSHGELSRAGRRPPIRSIGDAPRDGDGE